MKNYASGYKRHQKVAYRTPSSFRLRQYFKVSRLNAKNKYERRAKQK